MTTINLRDYYPWYIQDEHIEVSDEVAAELADSKRYERVNRERVRRNKSFYSLDADESEPVTFASYNNSPERIFDLMERHCSLCHALNSLPENQGRRIDSHYLLGVSQEEIAKTEGVTKGAVSLSITRGLEDMKKLLTKNF